MNSGIDSTAPAKDAPDPNRRRTRVYQQWQGNERFFCWGFVVAGPNWKSCIGSLALVIAPSVVFLIWVAPYMSQHYNWSIFAISCVFPCLSVLWLLMTACRDPGILPRQEADEEWLAGRKPRVKDVLVNGHRVQVRYNDTCHFYQPPRAHHCSVNDNCIERFDHHCPWVGTTIGQRNYRTFLLFVYTTSMYITWTFAICLWSLFVKHDDLVQQARGSGSANSNHWIDALDQSPAALALMAYTFLFFWFVAGLSGFHTYLTATNQTTYENFRYNHSSAPNPYDRGCLRNCGDVWCVPTPPSKVKFRAFVDDVHKAERVTLRYPSYHSALGPPVDVPSGGSTMDEQRLPSFVSHTSAHMAPAVEPAPNAAAAPHAAMQAYDPQHMAVEMPDLSHLAYPPTRL